MRDLSLVEFVWLETAARFAQISTPSALQPNREVPAPANEPRATSYLHLTLYKDLVRLYKKRDSKITDVISKVESDLSPGGSTIFFFL